MSTGRRDESISQKDREKQTIRMAVSGIKTAGRATQGVRLINIKDGDSIAAVSVVNKSEEDNQEVQDQNSEQPQDQVQAPEVQ